MAGAKAALTPRERQIKHALGARARQVARIVERVAGLGEAVEHLPTACVLVNAQKQAAGYSGEQRAGSEWRRFPVPVAKIAERASWEGAPLPPEEIDASLAELERHGLCKSEEVTGASIVPRWRWIAEWTP
jgi:hypothetical protein